MGSREEDDGKGGSPTLRQAEHVPKREGGGGHFFGPRGRVLLFAVLRFPHSMICLVLSREWGNGLYYRDYDKDPFSHSLLRTRQ